MKKVIIVSILILALICSFTTVVRATDIVDIEDDYQTIENPVEEPEEPVEDTEVKGTAGTEGTTETPKTTEANKPNPQAGVKEEAPIIIITVLGIGVAIYAGRKIKQYNY